MDSLPPPTRIRFAGFWLVNPSPIPCRTASTHTTLSATSFYFLVCWNGRSSLPLLFLPHVQVPATCPVSSTSHTPYNDHAGNAGACLVLAVPRTAPCPGGDMASAPWPASASHVPITPAVSRTCHSSVGIYVRANDRSGSVRAHEFRQMQTLKVTVSLLHHDGPLLPRPTPLPGDGDEKQTAFLPRAARMAASDAAVSD